VDVFQLSPGITPLLTDALLVEFVLLAGGLYRLAGPRGFELAVALNALVFGAIKLGTDFTDLLDIPVAMAGLVGGGAYLVRLVPSLRRWSAPSVAVRLGALLLGAIGVAKVALDFYDPFDVLLALLVMVLAFWWLTSSRRPTAGPSAWV